MGFVGVYKALYDYAPQTEEELAISEGDILYLLEKSDDDDWWKVKKKAETEDDDEPTGIVPNNYIEEAQPVGHARALYEYTRQTDEELSFPDDAKLQVFDTTDPDWILVRFNGDFGFAPANYIEMDDGQDADEPERPSLPVRPSIPAEPAQPQSPPLPARPTSFASEATTPNAPPPGAAAALASVMQGRAANHAGNSSSPPARQVYLSDEASDDEPSPALPARPRSQSNVSYDQPPPSSASQRVASHREDDDDERSATGRIAPGGFHMYNINEMVSVMGKKKKMPTTLGINLKTGVILIAPERSQDGPSQEWTADKMTHYSREGKHLFLELVRPSKSIDFHCGAKDTAEEIVGGLGEMAGAVKAEGLREIIAAGSGQRGQKKGVVLYDFMAQGDDEVSVAAGDEVLIVDDSKSDEWWQVKRLKNGKEGVVPSIYVEITETVPTATLSTSGLNAGKSYVAQNRLEEESLAKEAVKKEQRGATEVGPGVLLPDRHSSLSAGNNSNHGTSQRNKRENGRTEGSRSSSSKSKPDASKTRTWTDRSGSFSVDAQFLGLKDGKINLHKTNGVKIAVPVVKMSVEDLEYVERMTGISLDEDKPLSEVKRARAARKDTHRESSSGANNTVGASIEVNKPEYDWFQFFLSCDVAVGLCERYAQAFAKDSMDESVLPDVDASVLRTLGLREGDIIKVMRYLDKKFSREGKKRNVSFAGGDDNEGENGSAGGLFSGPGGALRNNTRKGRPAPAVQTTDTVDAKVFSQQRDDTPDEVPEVTEEPPAPRPNAKAKQTSGFDDDAWDVKPARQQPEPQARKAPSPEPKVASSPPPVQQGPPTQAMKDLSLLSTPLEPTKIQPNPTPAPVPQVAASPQTVPPAQVLPSQPTGATPGFFTALAQQQTGIQPMQTGQIPPAQPLNLGLGNRQRPMPPQVTQNQGSLMPPPPPRPLSAPQSAQPSGFAPPPLQPQMTGIAPPGQSLNELNQQRYQQAYMGGFAPQPTGQQMMGFGPGPGMLQQPNYGSGQFMQPAMTGVMPQMQSPFADPRPQQISPVQAQPTGFPGPFTPGQPFQNPASGINSYLPPALEPQRTGMPQLPSQQTGFGGGMGPGFNPGMSNAAPQAPPIAPLQPQKTGPAPPVRFGVPEKIMPQPTGRRANLAHATPENPFGF